MCIKNHCTHIHIMIASKRKGRNKRRLLCNRYIGPEWHKGALLIVATIVNYVIIIVMIIPTVIQAHLFKIIILTVIIDSSLYSDLLLQYPIDHHTTYYSGYKLPQAYPAHHSTLQGFSL